MVWVRLDEQYANHPKVRAVGPLGSAMQVAALCYVNTYLTDGFVPYSVMKSLIDTSSVGVWDESRSEFRATYPHEVAAELVAAGMWIAVAGGYQIHDVDDYQPSKEQVLRDRQQKIDAGRKGGQARAQAIASASAQADTKQPPKRDADRSSSKTVTEFKPVPEPVPEPVPVTDSAVPEPLGSAGRAQARVREDSAKAPTAKQLTAEHVGRCKARPPKAMVDRTGREVAQLLTEGVAPDAIRAGLELLRTRAKHPSLLPALVNEHLNPPSRNGAGPEHITPPPAPRCEHDQHAKLCDICHPRPAAAAIPDWRAALRTAGRAPPPTDAEPEVIV